MTALLAGWWAAIWPNLAANVLWMTPAFVAHHLLMRRHLRRHFPASRPPHEEPHA